MPLPVAAWVALDGRPVAEVINMSPAQLDRPIVDLLLVLVQQVAADQARIATEMQRIASELGVK